MNSLLLEIGSEEIPAGYIEPALNALSSTIMEKMTGARIEYGKARVFGTPRKLAVEVKNVAGKQKPLSTEVIGPPEKVGFDKNGRPTVAAEKFAEKVGIPVDKLTVKETEKGRYLCATMIQRGLATRSLLKSILPEAILSTPFPKTMKWGELHIEFARPIHYILALLGTDIISFDLGDVKSGRYTYGHYFMKPGKIKISNPKDYLKSLQSAKVIADLNSRKKRVIKEVEKAAQKAGGQVLVDDELVDIVKNLVEYPVATVGRFEKEFLEVPREILITAMREHQKYFAIVDKKGNLKPAFIAVNNTQTKNMSLVATGHERVLRARLSDAKFFFRADMGISFKERVEKLKGVLFQARLGTVYEKAVRVQKITRFLADRVEKGTDLKKHAARAALLCKADLVSHVVGEFPKLQGIMGRVYADLSGEGHAVAMAIEEHYRPIYSGGELPETAAGSILGIADKIDTICGCFSVGLIPTGASDPYALRRQGIGIIQIMLKRGFSISLPEMIKQSIRLYGKKKTKEINEIAEKVFTFFKNRMIHLLGEEGYPKDVIASVMSVVPDQVPDVWNRVLALSELKAAPDFEPIAVAFKRVVNIMKKAGDVKIIKVNTKLFKDASESKLYSAYKKVHKKVSADMDKGNLKKALHEIASLRNLVDAFFDDVLVMDKDKKIRGNRLALLNNIASLFENFADFSKIST